MDKLHIHQQDEERFLWSFNENVFLNNSRNSLVVSQSSLIFSTREMCIIILLVQEMRLKPRQEICLCSWQISVSEEHVEQLAINLCSDTGQEESPGGLPAVVRMPVLCWKIHIISIWKNKEEKTQFTDCVVGSLPLRTAGHSHQEKARELETKQGWWGALR